MVFTYFIQFDEDGEIGCFCKNQPSDCSENCSEYVVRLSPIRRNTTKESIDKFSESVSCLNDEATRLASEIKKAGNKIRRNFK